MPLPKGYLPRKDDILTIDLVVKHDVKAEDDYVFTKVLGSYADVAFTANDPDVSVRLKRRSWRDGEGVIHRAHPRWWGEVISTHGDHAVIALDEDADPRGSVGRLRIFHCNELLPWPGEKPAGEYGDDIAEPAPPLPAAEPEEKDCGTDFVPKF
jgi:hypothetical protein